MIDFFNIANSPESSQVFYSKGSTDWQVWKKPANCKMVMIFCIGGGGGGGGGQSGTASTTRRGGGGGGSSGYSMGLFSSVQIPDTLFLQVAQGGSPGIGATGGTGGTSYVSVYPDTTAINILMQSNESGNPAGAGGQGSSAGAGGSFGRVWRGSILSDLGLLNAYAGQTGGTGQTNTIPTAISPEGLTCGGAGGAGTNLSTVFNGGEITGSGFLPTIQGGSSSSSNPAGDGSGGFTSLQTTTGSSSRIPLIFTGGAGGGSSNSSSGGNGGNGSFGSGGGGGGVGVTSSAGNGGSGGNGLIIITCY